jgi:glycosyltransferase involved in cell wall biosynthesis
MGTYHVILTCRNSEDNMKDVLQSIKEQTIKPEYVIIIDDGSKDKTSEILKEIQKECDNNSLYIMSNPDLGYNIGRVVSNWNKAIKFAQEMNLKKTDYHMIGTDDTVYEKQYAEKVMAHMDADPKIAIASGNFDNMKYITPHGAGRFVRNSFFIKNHGFYPEKMGYESIILYTAHRAGYTYTVLDDARFKHTRKLGKNHHFYEFGASMRTLGFHPIFVFVKFAIYFISGKPIGRKGAIYMFYYYLRYNPKNKDYDRMHDTEIREYIKKIGIQRIKERLSKIINKE